MAKKKESIFKPSVRNRGAAHQPDYVFLAIVAMVSAAGLVTLFSASAAYGQERFADTYFFIRRQFLLGVIPGIAAGLFFYYVPLSFLKKISIVSFGLSLAASFLAFFPPIGVSIAGASRWIAIGPIQFQPSEFLKIGAILYLAALLSRNTPEGSMEKQKKLRSGRGFSVIPFLFVLGLIAASLIFQPDIGTLAVLIAVALVLYFISGTSAIRMGAIAGVLVLFGIGLALTAPYRLNRIAVFLDPKTDPLGIGYQINQILIAIGSGGISGLGLGMSQQKFGFIPQPIGDSIFGIFAEEFGFIGSITIIFLFILLIFRGFKIARRAPNSFSYLACVGIAGWIGIQAFVNIGAMVGLIPLTGIPLPFFSYGGSAMTALFAGMGIMLNISKHTV